MLVVEQTSWYQEIFSRGFRLGFEQGFRQGLEQALKKRYGTDADVQAIAAQLEMVTTEQIQTMADEALEEALVKLSREGSEIEA